MTHAIILAGGTGTRVGAKVPKQFIEIQGKPILAYTLDLFQQNPNIDDIEVVCHRDWIDYVKEMVARYGHSWNDPAYDFGRVIGGYDFDDPDVDAILEAYFGRPATKLERLHWIAYVAIHDWYYVNWALYKESISEFTRDWMLYFYKYSKKAMAYALPK